MEPTRPAPLAASDSASLAKAALRRLAMARLEPTPENYSRAWRMEGGSTSFASEAASPGPASAAAAPDADGAAVAVLIERIVRGLERSSRGWTPARKKESLQRILDGSRSDLGRLQQRLGQLVKHWDGEPAGDEAPLTLPAELGPPEALDGAEPREPDDAAALPRIALEIAPEPAAPESAAPGSAVPESFAAPDSGAPAREARAAAHAAELREWLRGCDALGGTLREALPSDEPGAAREAAAELSTLQQRLKADGISAALVDDLEAACERAGSTLRHRRHLLDQLGALCRELTESLVDLAEDDSWARGQCEAMRGRLAEGLTARSIRAVSMLLRDTRNRQAELRNERWQARQSLRDLIDQMLSELDTLGDQTGQFSGNIGHYADVIERADSVEVLADTVRAMVRETRSVQERVQQTQTRLRDEHGKAEQLTRRVAELESEMRRLSNEVARDPLTQIANRRGLMQAFDTERARADRSGRPLSIGLLDIDNFKRLNDELGHGAGDEALKSLATVVSRTLRAGDHVARYGGEEFVVLLPETPLDEARETLTRLQRSLTGGLFMHESKQVFVTFSAGVTAYRGGEALEAALERADQGLYEAKRTGKNRTCIG